MTDSSAHRPRPDYGVDAPTVVRNLLLFGIAGLLLWSIRALGIWPGDVVLGPIAGARIEFPLASMGLWAGIGMTAMALWMVWESKIGKLRHRERLLDLVTWKGDAQVLDVGCGRGLLLLGAARRLSQGRATGIDLWRAGDLSGNRPESTLENACLEGVADRVEIHTADMRRLPFPDASFDVVVSSAAIHNLASASDRAGAIGETVRVLRPGSQVMIDDIRHCDDYAALLASHGCEVRRVNSRLVTLALALITMGSLRPGTLVAVKAARPASVGKPEPGI